MRKCDQDCYGWPVAIGLNSVPDVLQDAACHNTSCGRKRHHLAKSSRFDLEKSLVTDAR
jgi:hypothetical protein